ncbi:MAG TPA: tripartite tricarboxylate transporter substrate binding protein [Burkholderiales bacterium]|nr:tripartite tricarboxylate transporter substrate binding protein [Burkholderiales bacterium]
MDIIARHVGPKLTERLGEPVVVENRPGASGNIGAEAVAKAAPDGHTLMVGANTLVIASNLYKNVPFDPLRDFSPVTLAATTTMVLVVNPGTGIQSVRELVARAKAQPGKLTYGSPGVGTPHHMGMELFKDLTGTDLLHVPYKGSAGAVTDLVSGQINVMLLPIHQVLPYRDAGRLRLLAAAGAKRHPSAPDLPTLGELGIKGAEAADIWYAFYAPRGVPAPVIAKLNAELRAILAQPEAKAVLQKVGLDAASSTPEELFALMKRDYARWGEIIRRNHIAAE